MPTIASNNYMFELNIGNIHWGTDVFKIALMASGFVFNEDTMDNWSDVSAQELSGGFGYITGGATLTGVTPTRDDPNNRTDVTANDVTWNASGASIGPSPGSIIYKDTGVASTSTVVGFQDFGGNQTAPDGAPFIVRNIVIRSVSVAT